MKILVINGPNLNLLGIREPGIYGNRTLKDLENLITAHADKKGVSVSFFQTNHEGKMVDAIQSAMNVYDGIIINPAAYTHTSVAILDAVKSTGIKTVEVHISDPDTREDFRKISYIRLACIATVKGKGFDGYLEAMDILADAIQKG
ncbi:MAG: 3-dehydroquinate dehydratase [Clostridia bacterium]|nr:3-dehydroquinate dehydratase [Clostridia bacterium]MBQ5770351.1 3-dehydroquinate dehydratase [Clostridia bacterium]